MVYFYHYLVAVALVYDAAQVAKVHVSQLLWRLVCGCDAANKHAGDVLVVHSRHEDS